MIRAWFPTLIYSEPLIKSGLGRFNADLANECRSLRDFDKAGREWSRRNYPGGYTSYASLNELHRFSSTFTRLERRIARHVRLFARALDFDLFLHSAYLFRGHPFLGLGNLELAGQALLFGQDQLVALGQMPELLLQGGGLLGLSAELSLHGSELLLRDQGLRGTALQLLAQGLDIGLGGAELLLEIALLLRKLRGLLLLLLQLLLDSLHLLLLLLQLLPERPGLKRCFWRASGMPDPSSLTVRTTAQPASLAQCSATACPLLCRMVVLMSVSEAAIRQPRGVVAAGR